MHKLLKMIAVSGFLALSVNAYSQVGVDIHVRPPRAFHEKAGRAPAKGMVWQGGYHRWDEGSKTYVKTHGVWATPPQDKRSWSKPHYTRSGGAWHYNEGHWN